MKESLNVSLSKKLNYHALQRQLILVVRTIYKLAKSAEENVCQHGDIC